MSTALVQLDRTDSRKYPNFAVCLLRCVCACTQKSLLNEFSGVVFITATSKATKQVALSNYAKK